MTGHVMCDICGEGADFTMKNIGVWIRDFISLRVCSLILRFMCFNCVVDWGKPLENFILDRFIGLDNLKFVSDFSYFLNDDLVLFDNGLNKCKGLLMQMTDFIFLLYK